MAKYTNYRKLWEKFNGPIPRDKNGIKFDIHHIDGDRTNNVIENLVALSMDDHYDLHYKQGDWGACKAIDIRRKNKITPEERAELTKKIHTGRKNSEETKRKMSETAKGKNTWSKGRPAWNKGLTGIKTNKKGGPNPFFGKTHTDEVKKKLSDAKKGKPWTQARRDAQKRSSTKS